jgi:hypothetical protein
MEFLSLSAQMTMTILPFTKVRATGHGISASLEYLKIYVDWTISALLSNYLAQHFVLPPTHVTRCLALLSAMEPSNVLAWDDPIKGFNKAHKSLGLLSPCACLWGDDCKKAQVIFALNSENGANDLRGVTCIELKLAGMTEKKSRWRSIMLKNLGLKEEPKTFTGGQGFSCSSPLDHSAAEITVEENDAKPSTTVLSKEEADRIGHFMTDWEHSKMRMVKQNTLFCLIIPESFG